MGVAVQGVVNKECFAMYIGFRKKRPLFVVELSFQTQEKSRLVVVFGELRQLVGQQVKKTGQSTSLGNRHE